MRRDTELEITRGRTNGLLIEAKKKNKEIAKRNRKNFRKTFWLNLISAYCFFSGSLRRLRQFGGTKTRMKDSNLDATELSLLNQIDSAAEYTLAMGGAGAHIYTLGTAQRRGVVGMTNMLKCYFNLGACAKSASTFVYVCRCILATCAILKIRSMRHECVEYAFVYWRIHAALDKNVFVF